MVLLKGLRFLLSLSILCVIGVILTSYPGAIKFEWFDYVVELPVGLFIALLFVVFAFFIFILNVWRYLWALPQNYVQHLQKKRLQKGHNLLIDGLSAIAAGQNNEAKEIIRIASELIPDDAFIQFIAAQASMVTGDEENATNYYLALQKNRRTSFLGLRGLIIQAKERGDFHLAQDYIHKAIALRPDSPWVQSEYINNGVRLAQKGVFTDVEKHKLAKYMPASKWQRYQAMIYWLKLQNSTQISNSQKEKLHLKVFDLAPDWVLNVKQLVEFYIEQESLSKAQKILTDAFKKMPHRLLGYLWDSVFHEMEPVDRYRTMEKLVEHNVDHSESLFSLTVSGIKAQLWGQAKQHLDQFLSHGLSRTGCNLMAELMEQQYPAQFDLAREWWQRASQVASDYGWQCDDCHTCYDEWRLVCDCCQSIDQVHWQQTAAPHRLVKGEIDTAKLLPVV